MGITAENLAKKYSISRDAQEEFSFHSHRKALNAQTKGHFDDELIQLQADDVVIKEDGCIRSTSVEQMSTLNPAFIPDGTVTAATSSPLTDGAACNLICSSAYASENSMRTLAEILSTELLVDTPAIMRIRQMKAEQNQ